MAEEAPDKAETGAATDTDSSLGEDALVSVVQDVLENILSKRNLVKDHQLAAAMNPQMYIPVMRLMEHQRLIDVGATESALLAAAGQSPKLAVDERGRMVRPLLKSKRNTIILRDMPEDTTEEEVRALFHGCPGENKLEHARPEFNNTWFVKFKLDGTQEIVLWLRDRNFRGGRVNAGIKSDHFLRSSFTPAPLPGDPSYVPPDLVDVSALGHISPWLPPPPPPPNPPARLPSMQPPGYWQPWGQRLQPAPLIFNQPTPPGGAEGATADVQPRGSEGKGAGGKGDSASKRRGKGGSWNGGSATWWSSGGDGGGGWWSSNTRSSGKESGNWSAKDDATQEAGDGVEKETVEVVPAPGKWIPVEPKAAEEDLVPTYGKHQLLAAFSAQQM